jgi:flagella basal body P-ring formation protein FlgA
MRTAASLLVVVALCGAASADTLTQIIGDRAAVGLPAELAITAVHLPRSLAGLDLDGTTVDVDFPAAARPGRASVKVRLRAPRARTVFVPVTIGRVLDVAIALHDLAPGEVITAADVRWERRAADPTTASAPVGQQVTAVISAGDVLDDARLTAPPPMARGTEVHVVVRRGVVTIHARGKLEQAARLGAPARVRLGTGTFVSGTLADGGRVLVEAL